MIRALLLSSAAILAGANAMAQAPRTIAYQGYLTANDGVPVNASVEMYFALYATSIGGSPIWAESQTVPVANGAYDVMLGATEPLPDPFMPPLFLGVRVGADEEMAPRQVLSAAPYALFAERVRCTPGDIVDCYTGNPPTLGVGICIAGQRHCSEAGIWGPCEGAVLPSPEACSDAVDNDCNGMLDCDDPDCSGAPGCAPAAQAAPTAGSTP